MNTLYNVESFSDWVLEYIKKSEQPIVKSAQENVDYFFEYEKLLKEKYDWLYYDDEAFEKLVSAADTAKEMNILYWKDIGKTIAAYNVTLCFRANEVLRSAIRSLNNQEIVPAAILTRSLLELASTMIENPNIIRKTISEIPNDKTDCVIVNEELEKFLLRIVWGTRLGKDIPEHLNQKNILTTLDFLSKNENGKDLRDKYNFLCELAHPNWLGNVRFLGYDLKQNNDGSVIVEIKKKGYSTLRPEIIENIVWGISCSAVWVRQSSILLQEANKTLKDKFEIS